MHNEDLIQKNTEKATGRTTRLADQYIQDLFNNGFVKIRDHVDKRTAHFMLFEIVLKRLQQEHSNMMSVIGKNIDELSLRITDPVLISKIRNKKLKEI